MTVLAKEALPATGLVMYDNKTTVMSIREMGALGWLDNIKEPPKDPSYAIRNESDVGMSDKQYDSIPSYIIFNMTPHSGCRQRSPSGSCWEDLHSA